MSIRIGTRRSPLAMAQARIIAGRLGGDPEIKGMTTTGDRIKDAPLSRIGGKGLFTKELDRALLDGEIDLAVHSMKDVPTRIPDGLVIAAVPKRADPRDLLVSRSGGSLMELPPGTRLGTSSLRRRAQVLALRRDIEVIDIRGSVGTRIRRIEEGMIDATILATAGVGRLGEDTGEDPITGGLGSRPISEDEILPAVGQGALAVVSRRGEEDLSSHIDHPASRLEVTAERAFMARIEGGCQVPVGAIARVDGGGLLIRARILSLDGGTLVEDSSAGEMEDAEKIGRRLGEGLLSRGGADILSSIEGMV